MTSARKLSTLAGLKHSAGIAGNGDGALREMRFAD
jgi:hypothetical protein